MSTITREFTKEQLIEKLRHRVAVTANYPDVEEAQLDAAIFKIALASLEAEPVAEWTNKQCLEFLSIAFRHAEINGDLQLDDIRLGVKIVNGSRAAMLQGADGNSPVIPDDVRRMDWLVSKTVDVREPMVYGSHSLFWSQAITDEEDDYHATKLREQIDAAMAAEQAAAPQQEVKNG